MATLSDSKQGGFKRRLARSPIRTRSRSRNFASKEFSSKEKVPSNLSSTALEYSLKRKHPHRLEPIPHCKKTKLKAKYTDLTVHENKQSDGNSHSKLTKVKEHSNKNFPRFSRVFDDKPIDITESKLRNSPISYKCDVTIASHSACSKSSSCEKIPTFESKEVCLGLDNNLCHHSYLGCEKSSPFNPYARLSSTDDPISQPLPPSTSVIREQVKELKSNRHKIESLSSKDKLDSSSLAFCEQSFLSGNSYPEPISSQSGFKDFSHVLKETCGRTSFAESSLSKFDNFPVASVEKDLNALKLTKVISSESLPLNETSVLSQESNQFEKSIFEAVTQTEKRLQHIEILKKIQVESDVPESRSDYPEVLTEKFDSEKLPFDSFVNQCKSKTTGSCTSSRSRHSSCVSKLPPSGSTASGGGTSHQLVIRARTGMSGTDTGQESSSNSFLSEGSSARENAENSSTLLEARSLPPHLFGALRPRMQHLLHRSIGSTASNRAHQLLQGLQAVGDEGQQLQAVMEMCQLLVMGNEDTLTGFPVKQVVPVLVNLLSMEHNFDMMNHACRALTYMMEALPRSSAVVVEAVPVFLEKLQIIQCMDVAEQSLTALEMLSRRHSKAILHAKGVAACLMYLDFFSINAQRAALSVTANCCQSLLIDEFILVQESLPLLSARLSHQDKKSVESVCLAFSRLAECFQNDSKCLIEIASHGLLSNIQQLLIVTPPVISSATFVSVIRMLAVICAACPELAVVLLKQNVTETLRYLLMGNITSTDEIELIQRSPQELFEITSLISELMPRLPNDGIFAIDTLIIKQSNYQQDTVVWQWRDDRGLWHPYTSVDSKIMEAAHQSGEDEISLSAMGKTYTIDFNSMTQINEDSGTTRAVQRHVNNVSGITFGLTSSVECLDSRIDSLQTNADLASSCIKSLFAVLYEVYTSSAGPAVRHKCLRAILRMIYFAPSDLLRDVLKRQTVSSHIAAMLASQDLRIVVAALQIAEILMQKLPSVFEVYFRREGVMHQIRWLTKLEITSDSLNQSKDTSSSRSESVPSFSLIPALIPVGTQSGILGCNNHHASLGPSMLPMSANAHSSDSAMHFSGNGGLWSSSSSVSTSFENIQSPASGSGLDESHCNNVSQLRLSDVLKRKRTPKRSSATSRKVRTEETARDSFPCSGIRGLGPGLIDSNINPILGSSMITLSACNTNCHNPAINASPILGSIASSTMCSSNSSSGVSGQGKLSSAAAKTSSFFANLNPARWGRWSNNSPVTARLSTQESCMLQRSGISNSPGNREKVKTWIKEQAKKFDEQYFSSEHPGFSHSAMNVLNRLNSALGNLELMGDSGIKALFNIRNIIVDSDISSFEVIHSGLVKKLLFYLTMPKIGSSSYGSSTRDEHLRTFLHVFLGTPIRPLTKFDPDKLESTSLLILVSKLNACASQLEQFVVRVHDLPGAGYNGARGTSALKFFNTHQLKCNLQRHPTCSNLRQWQGGPVKIDPLALVQAIERYLVIRGYGKIKNNEEEDDEGSDDDNSDDDIDDTMAAMMINQGQGRHKLQFMINENVLPYNMTVYQAIRQFESSDLHSTDCPDTDTESENLTGYTNIWVQTHTIWYRPIPNEDAELSFKLMPVSNKIAISTNDLSSLRIKGVSPSSTSPNKKSEDIWNDGIVPDPSSPLSPYLISHLPDFVTVQDPSLEVICLLRVIHSISCNWGYLYQMNSWAPAVPQTEFMNAKLTAKANRQLQDPLAIMTGNVPSWLSQIAYACPFLFPFEARHLLFYVTSFDRDRALQRLLDITPDLSNSDSSERVTPRLDRRKRTVSRDDLLKQAEVVMQDLGSSKALLEIQYESEVGTGLGPTLEFYALVSKELQRGDLDMWRGEKIVGNDESDHTVSYMFCPKGLFPMPLSRSAKIGLVTRVRSKFKFLGKFLAKALMDSRMLDIPLSLVFYKWMLNQENNLFISDLKHIDEVVAQSILQLEEFAREKRRLENDKTLNSAALKSALDCITVDGSSVESLNLDFTLPGFSHIEMRKGGKDILVTIHNLEDYLKLLRYWTMNEGVRRQMEAFKEGFESVFSLNHLKMFYPDELEHLFCGSSHSKWDMKSLIECCQPDHGYSHDSRAIKFLFEILSSYNKDEQRQFLQFVTGSPRLPVGGLKSLSPPLTIVRKTLDSSDYIDSYLPSVMTCVNYLKLPDYSSIEVMREKLQIAMSEGQHSFHLS